MQDLIQLARQWRGKTGYNPTVAAAVVVDGVVISTGVHRGDGSPHAEVDAIQAAGEKCKDAVLYVTLEPCTHFGKTPPCVNAIQEAGFSKVVYAVEDPNPNVRGKGGAKSILTEAGIDVVSGVCEAEAYALNREFFYTMRTRKPFVSLKIAQSHNAKIPLGRDGAATMISGDEFLKQVHQLRGECDVIVTGVGTIMSDDPKFDVRYGLKELGYRDPGVVILDPSAKTPENARVFQSTRSVVMLVDKALCDLEKLAQRYSGATCIALERVDDLFEWNSVMETISSFGFRHALVESGPKTVEWALPHVQDIVLGVSEAYLETDCVDAPLDWRDCQVGYTAQLSGTDIVLKKIDT